MFYRNSKNTKAGSHEKNVNCPLRSCVDFGGLRATTGFNKQETKINLIDPSNLLFRTVIYNVRDNGQVEVRQLQY